MTEPAAERTEREQGTRFTSTYRYLWCGAKHQLKRAEEERSPKGPGGGFYSALGFLVLAASAIEALVNQIGEQTLGRSWCGKFKPVHKKLKYVLRELGHSDDLTAPEMSVFDELKDVRNEIAHGFPHIAEVDAAGLQPGEKPEYSKPNWMATAEDLGLLRDIEERVDALLDLLMDLNNKSTYVQQYPEKLICGSLESGSSTRSIEPPLARGDA